MTARPTSARPPSKPAAKQATKPAAKPTATSARAAAPASRARAAAASAKPPDGRPTPEATLTWLSVVRAYHLCDALLGVRLAEHGLRIAEYEVLANLHRTPRLTQQELARRCFVAKSGISMLVSRMEDEGTLRREPDPVDARIRRIALTVRGEALARRTLAVQDGVVSEMADPVSPTELAVVADVMQRVATRLEGLLR